MPQRKLTFPYVPMPVEDSQTGKVVGNIYRPIVPIQIAYKGRSTLPFGALVDSGSDRNLFPAATGLVIGVDMRKGKLATVLGIGGHKIKVYTWKLNLTLLATNPQSFVVEIDFSYEHEVPLLGRSGFFNFFKRVEFREKKRFVELTL